VAPSSNQAATPALAGIASLYYGYCHSYSTVQRFHETVAMFRGLQWITFDGLALKAML
jgi:hypothetical protein